MLGLKLIHVKKGARSSKLSIQKNLDGGRSNMKVEGQTWYIVVIYIRHNQNSFNSYACHVLSAFKQFCMYSWYWVGTNCQEAITFLTSTIGKHQRIHDYSGKKPSLLWKDSYFRFDDDSKLLFYQGPLTKSK